MSKPKITMELPPLVGVGNDSSLGPSGKFLTPKQKREQQERQEEELKRQEELKIQEEKKRQEELKRQEESKIQKELERELERARIKVINTLEQAYPPIPSSSAPATIGLISATLARHRARHAAYEKQLKFYNSLETKYGAIKGNDYSYLEALDRYHNDKEVKKEGIMHQSEKEKKETERRKMEKDEIKRKLKEQQEEYIRAQEEEIERQRQENMRREQQQQSYANYGYGYARSGPAQEPQLSPRSKLSRRYPSPNTERDALAILQFDPRSNPTQREIKRAFNRMAILLHPDKNLDNPDEASVLFKQVHSAYKLLQPQAGGISRRIKRKSKGKIIKSRKYKTIKRHHSKRRK
jgi:hypothetical protein